MADNFNDEMGMIGNPQFMGQQLGSINIDKVRAFIKKQKRLKGFEFAVTTGTSSFDLNLSGTARMLLGLAILPANSFIVDPLTPERIVEYCPCGSVGINVQFTVNNEIVIDTLDVNFLGSKLTTNEYYYVPRPLSGTDVLTMKFTNVSNRAQNLRFVLYYL
jgi:hypothetical protein